MTANQSVNDDEDVLQLLTGDDDYDAEIDEDVEEELLRDEFEESNIFKRRSQSVNKESSESHIKSNGDKNENKQKKDEDKNLNDKKEKQLYDDEDEDEEKESGRERFKSERILSLTSASSRKKEIPDSLESVKIQDVNQLKSGNKFSKNFPCKKTNIRNIRHNQFPNNKQQGLLPLPINAQLNCIEPSHVNQSLVNKLATNLTVMQGPATQSMPHKILINPHFRARNPQINQLRPQENIPVQIGNIHQQNFPGQPNFQQSFDQPPRNVINPQVNFNQFMPNQPFVDQFRMPNFQPPINQQFQHFQNQIQQQPQQMNWRSPNFGQQQQFQMQHQQPLIQQTPQQQHFNPQNFAVPQMNQNFPMQQPQPLIPQPQQPFTNVLPNPGFGNVIPQQQVNFPQQNNIMQQNAPFQVDNQRLRFPNDHNVINQQVNFGAQPPQPRQHFLNPNQNHQHQQQHFLNPNQNQQQQYQHQHQHQHQHNLPQNNVQQNQGKSFHRFNQNQNKQRENKFVKNSQMKTPNSDARKAALNRTKWAKQTLSKKNSINVKEVPIVKNLSVIQNKEEKKIESSNSKLEAEVGVDEDYKKKLEEQKRLREEILRKKEENRKAKAAQKLKSGESHLTTSVNLVRNSKQIVTSKQTVASCKPKSDQQQIATLLNRSPQQIKVQPLQGTKPTKTIAIEKKSSILIDGLAPTTNETSIKKFCSQFGLIESCHININNGKRQAIVKFVNHQDAITFQSKHERALLDLCIVQVSLIWFVHLFIYFLTNYLFFKLAYQNHLNISSNKS